MPTVMVVDDAPLSHATLTRLLQRNGYHTIDAFNGREAMEKLESSRPDLILLDINIPEVDGLELLERLHAHPQWQSLPVVMLTFASDTHTIHRAEQLGAKRYLVKAALSLRQLLASVREFTSTQPN